MNSSLKIDFHRKAYVCICVFNRVKPVLLVSREDGDWSFLCGDNPPEDAAFYRVVGIGHVVEHDQELTAVLDLHPNEEAERSAQGEPWLRIDFLKSAN